MSRGTDGSNPAPSSRESRVLRSWSPRARIDSSPLPRPPGSLAGRQAAISQCRLLAVSRASVYRRPAEVSDADRAIMALIDRQYLARPYYGSRRMTAWLAMQGHIVNRKRVQRLMRLMGLVAIYQRPNTSKPAPENKVYPYLLGGLSIAQVNQVWCADITYIPMPKGFLYLVAIMDWHSRAVLAWQLSNTLGADFCIEALEEALARYGKPEIFNTDQGCQFTSSEFTGVLDRCEITISMDGKGRCQGRDRRLATLLQRGATASEPRLPHAAANLRGRPVGMWTIGVADRLRFPRFSSELGRRGNTRLRPHTHRHHSQQRI